MEWTQWTADCSACAALCCHHLAFDAGADFGHDKPAGKACKHLSGQSCRLHDRLEAAGYPGCKRYDCLGAGQRTVAMGGGATVFAALRRLHDDHLMLMAAGKLPLAEPQETRRRALLAALNAPGPQTEARLAAYLTGPLPAEIAGFFKALRGVLSHR